MAEKITLKDTAVGSDTCRSILALDALQQDYDADDGASSRQTTGANLVSLRERGIVAIFRSQRITEGKYRNFAPARAIF